MSRARTNKGQALTELVLAVFRAQGALLARGDALVAEFGLTSARWQVLGAVALASQPITVPGVARAMGLTRQAVQKQVDLLRADGLLVVLPNPEHERSHLLRLTARGRKAFSQADARWNQEATQLAGGTALQALQGAREVLDELVVRLGAAPAGAGKE